MNACESTEERYLNSNLEIRKSGRGFVFSCFPAFQIERGILVLAFLLVIAAPAFAHDPYEISSTVRIETNRTLIEVEMEFNGAMLLVGGPRSSEVAEQAALFQTKLSELQQQAGQFFGVSGVAGTLSASGTNVTLGVENHVKFNLEYPATRSGLKLEATGLKALSERGPFGVGVTVLDLVNMKVLGQATLFANSPVAEFAPPVKEQARLVTAGMPTNAPPVTTVATPIPAKPVAPPKENDSLWILLVLGGFAVALVVLIRRWRAAGGSQ